ncbi:Hypothetical protein D9617_20g028420 [Elsinoe fawcettii]|nr:Hypothetical protein D9617_20g028420 [Elsinoe fawcettii]
MVATEIVQLPLKTSFDPDNTSSDDVKAQQASYKIISSAAGFQSCWMGPTVENDKEISMFINWGSVQDHIAFTKAPEYADMGKHLMPLLAGAPAYIHYHFTSQEDLETALSAPVTENVTAYFPSVDESFNTKLDQFKAAVEKDAAGAKGFAYGWGEEDVEHEKLPNGKGKALKLLIGWESVDAHMKFRDTEAFKKNVGLLRDGPSALTMTHTKAKLQS